MAPFVPQVSAPMVIVYWYVVLTVAVSVVVVDVSPHLFLEWLEEAMVQSVLSPITSNTGVIYSSVTSVVMSPVLESVVFVVTFFKSLQFCFKDEESMGAEN